MVALNSIAVIRAQKGMTPGQLAQVTRIGRPKIVQYERDAFIPQHHLGRIAIALGVGFAELAQAVAPPRRQLPPPYVHVVSDDPIQAEIDSLKYDLAMIENKDRYQTGDAAEEARIRDALYAAYEQMRDRDAVEWKAAAE